MEFTYDGSAMSVNQEYQLTCLAFGSQPVAIITWWIGDRMISTKNYKTEVNSKVLLMYNWKHVDRHTGCWSSFL